VEAIDDNDLLLRLQPVLLLVIVVVVVVVIALRTPAGAVALEGRREPLVKDLGVVEDVRQQQVEQRPELVQIVLRQGHKGTHSTGGWAASEHPQHHHREEGFQAAKLVPNSATLQAFLSSITGRSHHALHLHAEQG